MEEREEPRGKAELRRRWRAARAALGDDYRRGADELIAGHVAASDLWREAPAVLSYVSVGDEVDTRALLQRAAGEGKPLLVPRCIPETHGMTWHEIQSVDELEPNRHGILEPASMAGEGIDGSALPPSTLALVPALVVDGAGFRLGYGGGYYDRFLSTFSGVSLALIRRVQRVEDLRRWQAVEPCDQPVDHVADEHGVEHIS